MAARRLYVGANTKVDLAVISPRRELKAWQEPYEAGAVQLVADEDVPGHARISAWLSERADRWAAVGRSTGWYLQQYLKLAYAWNRPGATFVHDGDTIFSPSLLAEIGRRPMLLTTREDAAVYNEGCRRVGVPVGANVSLVANGGLFDGPLLRGLGAPEVWFERALEGTALAPGAADFSEYQIMGNLQLSRRRLPLRALRFFRRFDLLAPRSGEMPPDSTLARALDRYDAIAFERGHRRGAMRRVAGRLAYWSGRTW